MNSRPLPYQGSALPLSYASLTKKSFKQRNFKRLLLPETSLQSYRERYRPSRMRNAKYPIKTHVNERYFPGSIVSQISTANTPTTESAIHILPLPAGLRSTTFQHSTRTTQTSGAQGRIRTSVAHNAADLQSAAINHSATCAHPARPFRTRNPHLNPSGPSNDSVPIPCRESNVALQP